MDASEWTAIWDVLRRTERPSESLSERVQLLEDKEAIRDVVARYGFLMDGRRRGSNVIDALLELFTEDVERVLGGTLEEHVIGRKELARILQARVGLPIEGPFDESVHSARKRKSAIKGETAETVEVGREVAKTTALARHRLTTGEVVRVSDDGREAWATAVYTLFQTSTATTDKPIRGSHDGAYVFGFRKVDRVWKISRQLVITELAVNPLYQSGS